MLLPYPTTKRLDLNFNSSTKRLFDISIVLLCVNNNSFTSMFIKTILGMGFLSSSTSASVRRDSLYVSPLWSRLCALITFLIQL